MKTLNFLSVCLMIVLLMTCQKDEFKPGRETGLLHIDLGLSVRVKEQSSALKAAPRIEGFKVIIYRADGTEAMAFDSISVMPDTIELEIGNYYVEAHSDNDLPAAFDNPFYYGASDVFTISSNTQQTVTVNCELANTIVSVVYSDNTVSSFTDYETIVSSALGSLVFISNETRMGYFRTMPLDIVVELTYQNPGGSDTSKTLSGSIPDPLPNRHYEVFVDASPDGGTASFQILLDSTEVLVEVIELTDIPGNQQEDVIGYGEILITEIMFDPSALPDAEGEWFEIYNNSDQPLNLQNLVLGRDDVNRHIIADSIELLPGEYYVLARSGTATAAANSYVCGSDISLTNSGAVLAICNEGAETDPGPVIFSVDYGAVDFPSPAGASISLNPDGFSPAHAVLGTYWCTSTSTYSTGDMGTPGLDNDHCQQD
jgi:hypothetical protein